LTHSISTRITVKASGNYINRVLFPLCHSDYSVDILCSVTFGALGRLRVADRTFAFRDILPFAIVAQMLRWVADSTTAAHFVKWLSGLWLVADTAILQ